MLDELIMYTSTCAFTAAWITSRSTRIARASSACILVVTMHWFATTLSGIESCETHMYTFVLETETKRASSGTRSVDQTLNGGLEVRGSGILPATCISKLCGVYVHMFGQSQRQPIVRCQCMTPLSLYA